MKKLIFCLMAMCSVMLFVGCEKNVESIQNILLKSQESKTILRNGDTVTFECLCEFDTDVKFEVLDKQKEMVLQSNKQRMTPTTKTLDLTIDVGDYLGKAYLCLSYDNVNYQNRRNDKSSGEYWIEINIRDVNSPDTWDVETVTLEDIVEGCKDFDHETLAANIAGEWVLDTWVVYDDEWSYITFPLIVKGTHYTLGLEGGESFTFAADGTGTNYENYENSGTGTLTTRFNWVYNIKSSRLTCSGEYNLEWTVTGFSDEYIVLDRLDFDGDNIRTILKCKK